MTEAEFFTPEFAQAQTREAEAEAQLREAVRELERTEAESTRALDAFDAEPSTANEEALLAARAAKESAKLHQERAERLVQAARKQTEQARLVTLALEAEALRGQIGAAESETHEHADGVARALLAALDAYDRLQAHATEVRNLRRKLKQRSQESGAPAELAAAVPVGWSTVGDLLEKYADEAPTATRRSAIRTLLTQIDREGVNRRIRARFGGIVAAEKREQFAAQHQSRR